MTPTPRNKMLRRCKRCKTRAALPLDVYCQHCKPTPPGYETLHAFPEDRRLGANGKVRKAGGRGWELDQ